MPQWPSERTELLWSGFKASVDAGEGQRRRIDIIVGIRKCGRGSALAKRRGAAVATQHPSLAVDKVVRFLVGRRTKFAINRNPRGRR